MIHSIDSTYHDYAWYFLAINRKALGCKYSEKFSKKNTHLICKPLDDGSHDEASQKYIKAKEWGTYAIKI
jgi:hypothetical protein